MQMQDGMKASLMKIKPARGEPCHDTDEVLLAQHGEILQVLESWLASQEDRLSRLWISYAVGSSQREAGKTASEEVVLPDSNPEATWTIERNPEAVLQAASDQEETRAISKASTTKELLLDDVAVVTATTSMSTNSLLDSERPSTLSHGGDSEAMKPISWEKRRSESGANIGERLDMQEEAAAGSERSIQNICKAIVTHGAFEISFAGLIMLNALATCFEVHFSLISETHQPPPVFALIGHLLGVCFFFELVLRVVAYGRSFLSAPGYGWNYFDLLLVTSWCAEVALDIAKIVSGGSDSGRKSAGLSNMRLFRILRITRMFRLLRVARILRFVRALNLLVLSIITTMRSLVWASILLLIIIFTFAIFIGQSVADALSDCEGCPMDPELMNYWGTLPKACLSLLQIITNGKDWDDVARPLMDLGGFLLIILITFIIFSQFAVLNVVTGVFCQAAVESAQRDRELMVQSMVTNKQRFVDALGEQFASMFKQFSVGERGLSLEAFEKHMHVKSVREYFALLELDTSDAWMLFQLLDDDGSGTIDVEEFVDGCLRFKGTARSIDLAKLSMDFKHTTQRFNDELNSLNRNLTGVQKVLDVQGSDAATRGNELLSIVCASAPAAGDDVSV
eukprot:TRINITY_DN1881_c0_g5_i1.p1 TRINITY_DN1881_c0_g5~~TRINITY_DN1881_c0_g5_i1.p1  ORF type:complete len:624 (+),score=98.32 TRINITY_DN1881_c0_g5_i1:59-1930(+)